MRHHHHLATMAAGAAVAALALAACSTDDSAAETTSDEAAPEEMSSIPLYSGTNSIFAPVYYAHEEGLFEANGVDVTLNLFSSGTEAFESYRSAGAGLIVAGDLPSMRAWLVGDTVGVAPTSWDTGTFSLAVTEDIGSPDDLAGGTIATVVGSSGSYYVHNFLDDYGLLDSVEVLNLNPADMPSALARGDIDGFVWTITTIDLAIEATPGAYVLVEGSEDYLVNRILTSAAASSITDNTAAVQGAVAGLVEACEAINADKVAAAEVVGGYLSQDPEIVLAEWEGVNFDCGFDQAFVDDMTDEAAVGSTIGLTDGEIDWSTMFDTSFLENVDPALVSATTE